MPGIRLPQDLDGSLGSLARRQRRSKSEVARDAIRDYIARHDSDAELVRQSMAVAAAEADPDDEAFLDALNDELLREIHEEER